MAQPKHADNQILRPIMLENRIQHYAWGTRGGEAYIPRLLGIEAKLDTPYAELWIGAHPSLPSLVKFNGQKIPLDQFIAQNPEQILGPKVAYRFGNKLPFLFKVLSAGEALSIQAHPDKTQAAALHQKMPEYYPDDNHKPEIAIALDKLTALVGFKNFNATIQTLQDYPEIAHFIAKPANEILAKRLNLSHDEQTAVVRQLYVAMMQRSLTHKDELKTALEQLEKRLSNSTGLLNEAEQLFLSLYKKYQDDVGLFSLFILNMIHLKAGQAVFMEAGIPHSYLKGNIVECMANSDNVVRAGLTPKFKDIATLIAILTENVEPVKVIDGKTDSSTFIYHLPIHEFEIVRLSLNQSEQRKLRTHGTIHILLIICGEIQISNQKFSPITVTQGQTILMPGGLKDFILTAHQNTLIFSARVPE